MKVLLVLCLAVTVVVARNPYNGYHATVGIPLAAKIKAAEEAILSGSRIVGGEPAPLGAHPYLVGVVITLAGGSTSACGSSMLSNTKAVTAAHCWVDAFSQAQLFTLVFGSQYLFVGGVRVATSDVDVHPGWDGAASFGNDIAIITYNWVGYSNVIRPIALPSGALETSDFAGQWAQASGYGMLGDGLPLVPEQYQSTVTLQVMTNDACHDFFSPAFVTDKVLCTSGAGPVGVCSSDSGGPLSITDNGERVLIGVVSFGSVSCNDDRPSGYVRVNAHLPWIRQRI